MSNNQGRKIIITVQDKSGIAITRKIVWEGRPSQAIRETVKQILKDAAMNKYITIADLFHIISYCSVLNIPETDKEKIEAIQKEMGDVYGKTTIQ